MKPTLGQTRKLIEQADDAELSQEAMTYLLEGGLFTDLLKFVANPALRNRRDAKEIRSAVRDIYGLLGQETGTNLFASPAEQLTMFIEINKKHNLGFSAEQFASLGATPTEEANGLIVWTLEAMLATPEKTFEFVRSLMVSPVGYNEGGRECGVPSSCRIAGINPVCEWSPMTLRWVKIDLGADLGKTAKEATSKDSAHVGPMWQVVYSPNWFANIGKTVGDLFIPEVSLPGFMLHYGEEGGVPHLEPQRIRQHTVLRSYTNSDKGQAALAKYVQS